MNGSFGVVLDVVAAVLFVAGTVVSVIAVVGLVRLPDIYARMHAAAKPATLGAVAILGGAALRAGSYEAAAKLLVALALQLFIGPLAAHVLARAAHASGEPQSEHTLLDDHHDELPGATGGHPAG